MIDIKEKAECCGCGGCEQTCPVNAISMEKDSEGFAYPRIKVDLCIHCGKCNKVCPELNPLAVSENSEVYAAYRKNIDLRLKSQSGGIFSVIAEKVISDGGVVFGAVFDNKWKVIHKEIEKEKEVDLLRGSKYIQSDIGVTYKAAERYLKQGREVLFSGTPCQVQGLKTYLNREYDKLFTVDLICHGVSSPEVWNEYLNEYIGKDNIKEFIQKDKSRGNVIVFKLKSGEEKIETYEKNSFCRGFSKDLFLRPSCYQCSFKGIERCSDITIGDFWGIDSFLPEFSDKYGVSAVLVHTVKGKQWYNMIQTEILSQVCDKNWVEAGNPCLLRSISKNDKRMLFFEKWEKNGVIKTVDELTKISFNEKIILKIQKEYWKFIDLGCAVKKYIKRRNS